MDNTGRAAITSADELLDFASTDATEIGRSSILRSGTTLYEGVLTGDHLDTGHGAVVREGCHIGSMVHLGPGAIVKSGCVIGDNAVVKGFLADRSRIGEHATVIGSLLHVFRSGARGLVEPAPEIEPGAVIACGAVVIGNITIGRLSYVGANAVVRAPVPPGVVVAGNPARVLRDRNRAECPQLWDLVGGL